MMAHGDPHLGGRRVVVLRFQSGARLVYKPRPVEAAQRFQTLLEVLNQQGLEPQLRTIGVLACKGYGWMEHVAGRACRTDASVRRYFRRAGALIAALHVAGATDCHFENVLADGEHPVVIDLETLMRPQFRSMAGTATDQAVHAVEDSVLAIGMLPSLDGRDFGALAVEPNQTTQLTTIGLIDAGTPNVRVETFPWRLGDVPSLPLRRGTRIGPAGHTCQIESGFTDAYELIIAKREELLAPRGAIQNLGRSRVRVVLRPTSYYADILTECAHPAALYDAAEADRVADRIWREPMDSLRTAATPAELQQLALADIPYFEIKADDRTLRFGDGPGSTSYILPCSGLELAHRRLASMGRSDLSRQRGLLRVALRSESRTVGGNARPEDPLQAASLIGDALISESIQFDTAAAWLHVIEECETTPRLISPTDPWLYNGLLGIALFLAQLSEATGEPRYRATAALAVGEARCQIGALAQPAGSGVFEGMGGLVYAFSHLAHLLDDESLLRDAEQAASDVTPLVEQGLIGGDLIAGTAGLCLATLSLATARTSAITDRLLNACASDLQTITERDPDIRLPFARGASHGWSGVLLAISRLHSVRPSAELAKALGRAVEREVWLTSGGHWTDPGDSVHRRQASWCHGVPGIALCRVAAATAVKLDELDKCARSAVQALENIEDIRLPELGLCHGTPGVLEAILSASRARLVPARDLFNDACELVARSEGFYAHTFKPGLMTGLAGLGHELLRIAGPTTPSILTLDAPNVSERQAGMAMASA